MRAMAFGVLLALAPVLALAAAPPENAAAQSFVAQAKQAADKGDVDGAAQLLQSAIIYDPDDTSLYVRLGGLYARNAKPDLALKYFDIALNIDPTDAPALQGVAMLDIASGSHTDAEAEEQVLVKSCGAACPETAAVQKALENGKPDLDSNLPPP